MATNNNLKGIKLNKDLRESRSQNAVENKLKSDAKSGKSKFNKASTAKTKSNQKVSSKGKNQTNTAKNNSSSKTSGVRANNGGVSLSNNPGWLDSVRNWVNGKANAINKSLPNADGSSKNKSKVADKTKIDKSKKKSTEKPKVVLDRTKQNGGSKDSTKKVPGTTTMKDIRDKYGNKVPMDYSGNPARKLPGITSMDDIRRMYGNQKPAVKKTEKQNKTIKPIPVTPTAKQEPLEELRLPSKTTKEVISKYSTPSNAVSPNILTKEETSAIKAVLGKMAPSVTPEQKKGLLGRLKDRLSKERDSLPKMKKGGVIKSNKMAKKPMAKKAIVKKAVVVKSKSKPSVSKMKMGGKTRKKC